MITNTTCSAPTLAARSALPAGLLALGLALAGAGCGSLGKWDAASFATVTIENHSLEEIARATGQVFAADGYRGAIASPSQMVFEKEASRATSFAREGLYGSLNGAQTINRVKVDFVFVSGTSYRLQCKAYMVSGGSDPFFQDETPVTNMRSGPYQSLLDKVAKKFK